MSVGWSDVGSWVKDNAGTGAALVGSLLTGNIPGAVASGIALVSSATGQANPDAVLNTLQTDPATVVKLRELANAESASVREHIRAIAQMELEDAQAEHTTTQATIINSDNSDDLLVRWTRPLQSWGSLGFAGVYVFTANVIEIAVLGILLTLPFTYAGLRQFGKWSDGKATAATATAVKLITSKK